MEILARQILEELKLVWDGDKFVKVLKKGFKDIDPTKAQIDLIKFDNSAMANLEGLQSELYKHYLRLCDEFHQDVGITYANEMDFVRKEGFEKGMFIVNGNGTISSQMGMKKINERLKLQAGDYNRAVGNLELRSDMLKDALTVLIEDEQLKKLNIIRNNVKYDPTISADWDGLLEMMTVKRNHNEFGDMSEKHIRAIKHTIWQVKRKLFDLEVKYHLCLILYGKQGCGKSDFLRQLFEPLEEVYCLIDGTGIADKFGGTIFENHYVGNLDELSKITDKSIELVKQFITLNQITGRKIMTQIHEQTKQNMTLVGSSNRPINDVIYDFSGMRRWWQIEINKAYSHMDFGKIEAEDFMTYWKSVDENGPGFYTQEQEMMEYQDSFVALSTVDEFIELYDYKCNYDVENHYIQIDELYSDYIDVCKRRNNKVQRQSKFRAQLKERGFEVKQINKGTKKPFFVRITKEEGDEFE